MNQWNRQQNKEKYQNIIITKTAMFLIAFAIALFSTLLISQAVSAADVNEEGKAAAKAELKLDEGQEYHAYILFQAQNSWVFRGRFWEADKGPSSENWDKLLTSLNVSTPVVVDGIVEDTIIKGNGHYIVRLSGLNGSPSAGADNAEFGILGFSTDIPKNDTIKFDNISVRIDGVDKGTVTGDDVYYDKDDIDDPGLITVEVFNAWHEECKNLSLTLPNDTVEIGFDVSGFQYDNPNASGETEDTALDSDKKDSKDQKDTANQDNNGKAKDDRKDNKALPITIAVIIIIVLVAGSIYLMMKREKN
ncbi:MAG: hypothetical protein K2K70_02680 [Lachnospiraceae bacterium]|nr:hypothetical protein [Lachnospiraceae bacterium]